MRVYYLIKKGLLTLACTVTLLFANGCKAEEAKIDVPPYQIYGVSGYGNLRNYTENENFMLVETIEFDLTEDNPIKTYSDVNNHHGVVFFFKETSVPISYNLTYYYNEMTAFPNSGAFDGNLALVMELDPNTRYDFEFRARRQYGINESPEASGIIDVYIILQKLER